MPKSRIDSDEPSTRELRNCTCSRLRRAGRRVTQLYDQALGPAGLTIGQFGLLAYLGVGDQQTQMRVCRSVTCWYS